MRQVTKESVTLQPDQSAEPNRYEIPRTFTARGHLASVHPVSAGRDASPRRPLDGLAFDHRIGYAWNDHNRLASAKSLAGEFTFGYVLDKSALLKKMTGPVREIETIRMGRVPSIMNYLFILAVLIAIYGVLYYSIAKPYKIIGRQIIDLNGNPSYAEINVLVDYSFGSISYVNVHPFVDRIFSPIHAIDRRFFRSSLWRTKRVRGFENIVRELGI